MRRTAMFFVALLLTACQGVAPVASPSASPAASQPTATEGPAEATGAPPTATAVAATPVGVTGARDSIVRVVAEGTFFGPLSGQTETASQGTGFIIDPGGIVVTNNHVVTGGSIFKVFFGDSTTESTRATLIAQSECSDLAVLQLLGEDSYPSLSWYEGEVEPGLAVQAAGYPETTYSLREGQVTTSPTSLSTQWASVDSVIEHTAEILPGYSGGPLLTDPAGEVLAVDYARESEEPRSFAVAASQASEIVEELRQGSDVDSIGINGQAVANAGIWVASVKPGSPADRAVIKPGDLIYELGNLTVGDDGTMGRYCDVLIGQGSGAPLDVKWADWDVQTCYSAQLNTADRPAQEERCPEGLFPEPTPAPGSGLLDAVHASVRGSCTAATPWPGAESSLSCTPTAGADNLYFDEFPNLTAMNTYFDGQVSEHGIVEGSSCEEESNLSNWTLDGVYAGRLLCYSDDTGGVWFKYTHDALGILITAVRTDGDYGGLYQWWLDADEALPVQ